jgi:hypothetical protein
VPLPGLPPPSLLVPLASTLTATRAPYSNDMVKYYAQNVREKVSVPRFGPDATRNLRAFAGGVLHAPYVL